ncbi:Uncharacterized conserved protein YafD, endonuclease/exonuclease/phosphatase (EEP) superfamily [Salegentibacter echinorum]|uniref:Uncharacterized conserved protein YafD, endonuclease/exonuclease/phosphatase (EEP) superfamily n=1 Tax=Salegentibacter echinorum TaxID=1073325 RepID=A0A1M5JRV4_SALEC|nr:endonuclease/exonuclease/phosphatase family protein [Salegentibacter echinorum]SHG43248.1 Uncharacterized conserved protein YafD, endonuclease/exonuclease/phosphatase (EEP) superfamily [Salegentibacter echinorum]
MKKLIRIFSIACYLIAVLLIIFTVLSIFRNAGIRYLKMLDFPRIQMFIIIIINLFILWILIKKWRWYDYLITIGLIAGLIINAVFLINYTRIVPVKVQGINKVKPSEERFSLLMANVKMSNNRTQPLIDLVENEKPDLVLVMEVDEWWNKKLEILDEEYPYSKQALNELAYGMVLYSKLPLKNVEIDYLNNKNVPSFESIISLPGKKEFVFHSVHPVPPTYFKNLPDNAGQEEKALKKIGKQIQEDKRPAIVAGDLNDVVWSYVDNLTGTQNILYDVRIGRGFFNSFNANNFLMRWPLDHVFVTKEFRLKQLKRLPKIGSDHFPVFVELVL